VLARQLVGEPDVVGIEKRDELAPSDLDSRVERCRGPGIGLTKGDMRAA
jgi:hypothetical protein